MTRFYTVVQRSRRLRGRLVAVPALVALIVLVGLAATRGRTNWLLFIPVVVAPLATAVVWGTRRAFEARDYFEVDLAARRWVATTDGVREPERPLESIAPLTVTIDFGNPSLEALSAEYFIHPRDRIDLSFLGFNKATQAHVALEALAQRWQVESKRELGTARSPGQINLPLHERLAGDANAARALVISPAWGFAMQPLSPGYRFTFTRPRGDRWSYLALTAAYAAMISLAMFHYDVVGSALVADATLWSRLILGGCVFALLVCLAHARYGLFLAWPGSLVITPTGVWIRGTGSRMAFAELEEITCGADLKFVADGRAMTVPATWFPFVGGPMLQHEVTRAILETAPYAVPSRRG